MQDLTLTVSEFNTIMADIVHNQLQLTQLCITGDISQLNYYANKHLYLTLVHNNASLQCVVYNQHLKKIPVLKKGDTCTIIGSCTFLKNKGQLMFSGVAISVKGTGTQHAELQKLMATFKKTGLLTKKTPEQLPKYVSNICIITAEDSAAYHDMASIFANTPHPFHTTIIPCTMQGLIAANAISNAISIADSLNPDIICIARGGGAEQDFACYNDPQLATTIANTTTPLITGIGHQINTTLSCLCANNTVETPTALAQFLCHHAMQPLEACHHALKSIHNNLEQTIQDTQHTIHNHMQTLTHTITTSITQTQTHLATLCAQLTELNPLHKLRNGFAYCEANNTPLKSIKQVKKDDTINLTLCDGTLSAKVID